MTHPASPQRGRLRLFALVAMPWLAPLAGCGRDANTGPAKVKWDRDVCEHCGMVISDRHYAAQIRGGPGRKAHKFDDPGCAVSWLKSQSWAQAPDTEVWVADYRSGEWLDAGQAHYVSGKTTPMNYGFGAVREAQPGAVDFATMKSQVLARSR
jgi:copper chaperone NosL